MFRKHYIIIVMIISVLCFSSSFAFEMKETPIQDQMEESIFLASDSWDLSDKSGNSTTTGQENPAREKKSAVKAALYSALLPGLGEHYVGHRTKSKVFFATEALTWISYFAFHTYGEWKKDDMIIYAAEHAGASLEGKDDEFNDWVGFYNSTDEFNTLGRVTDPDRDFLTGSENFWQWTSEEDRENYRSYKNSSRTAFDRADFMIVAAISNRIISVIDAIRDAKRSNRSEKIDISSENKYNLKFTVDPLSYNKQFSLTLYSPF